MTTTTDYGTTLVDSYSGLTREEFIRGVLRGYNFSDKKIERLVVFFTDRLEKLEIFRSEKMQRYITETMYQWEKRDKEKRILSLDANKKGDSETENYNFVAPEDSEPYYIFGNQNKPEILLEDEKIPLRDALNVLRDRLDELDYKILKKFADRLDDSNLGVHQQILTGSTNDLLERLHQVARIFYNDGRIIIPTTRIFITSYNPLKIRAGNLDGETLRRIYEAYRLKMSSSEAAKYTGVSPRTILNRWKEAKLKPHYKREDGRNGSRLNCRSSLTIDEELKILRIFKKYGKVSEVRRATGHSPVTIRRKLKERGIELNSAHIHLTEKEISEIIEANIKFGGNVLKASKELNYAHRTIRTIWDEYGLDRLKPGKYIRSKSV